jgi:uncharacterized membrane protein YozB (DUF420 family)
MEAFMHAQGFLGTNANIAADTTLIIMILVGIMFTVGFVLARMGKYEVHRWVQTTAGAINLILVLWLMILPFRDFVVRDVQGPMPHYFYVITTLHATVGVLALLFGVYVILRGNNLVPEALKFNNYKGFMRLAYTGYMLTIVLGVLVYVTWFVRSPTPPHF